MLKHNSSTIVVFQSKEYNNFEMVNGNRALNQKKISRIIKEIESGNDMLSYYPIQVRVENEKLKILDGQHRYFISKKLKRPIYYILVTENKSMSDIAKVNSNVEKWKAQDFINCYIQQKNNDYNKLQEFLDMYKINIGTTLRLLTNGNPGTEGSSPELTKIFEHGLLKITHWDEAIEIANDCKRFEKFLYWRDRAFIIAIYRIKKAALISIDDLVSNFNKRPEMLVKQVSQKDYIYNLEQLVNVGKQKRIVIS
ncbi:MAG: hypothetical protein IPJ81_16255 [Chitinophagaceae bacterium]|nr:hypothetical protein [Chitinophagaceae bacterium]